MCRQVCLAASAITVILSAPAFSQSVSDFQRPWGTSNAQNSEPYRAGTRDANGNRVVLNGVLQTGVGVQAQMAGTGGVGNAPTQTGQGGGQTGMSATGRNSSALAVGNQLNVVVQGNYNTVIVNSTQTNNGNVTATSSTGSGEDDENGN
jgi:holdfast attachment protein HfaA